MPILVMSAPAQVVRGFGTLTLTGTGLSAATAVTVGGQAQVFSTNTATQILVPVVAAATPTGTQPIVVTTAGGSSAPINVDVLAQLRIMSATALSATSVQVTFNRDVDGTSVTAARFTIPTLTVSSASTAANLVTLTTSAQTENTTYTVSCDAMVLDAFMAPADSTATATFTGFAALPTEFVVVKIGDGTTALSTTTTVVTLERRLIATGAVVSTLALPTAASGANLPFTLAGSTIADGSLSRSPDGRLLAMQGYQTPPGAAPAGGVPRVVAVIDAADFVTPSGIDTSTTLATVFSNTAPRSAVIDGTNIWVGGGSGGTFLTSLGSTSAPVNIATTPSTLRVVNIYQGQLYCSTAAGLYQVGTGQPLTSSTATLVAATTSAYGFAVFDMNPNEPGVDLLYLVDDGSMQGIKRFRKTAGIWGAEAVLGPPVRQMACFRDSNDVVCVAATGVTAGGGTLHRLRDVNTATASSQTALTSIGTAPANTSFRGIALAPLP